MAGVKGRSGGARPGAGPKPTRVKYAAKVNKAEALYAAHLEQSAENLKQLADGGTERLEIKQVRAGTLFVEGVLTTVDDNGRMVAALDGKGNPIRTKVKMFPDLPDDAFVEVERKTITLAADREANQYITDRILGKPVTPQEVTGKDGASIAIAPVIGYEIVPPVTYGTGGASTKRDD